MCSFSGFKIYPGHGKKMVKSDGRVSNEYDIPMNWSVDRKFHERVTLENEKECPLVLFDLRIFIYV